MDIKIFYFTNLSCISLFSGVLLWLIWRNSQQIAPEKDSRGILFLALTQFSWVALGLYTLLAATSISNPVISTIVSGTMGTLNNIFLVISIAYFSGFERLKKIIPVLGNKDKWIQTTLMTFVAILMLLIILDNVSIGNTLIGKYLVVFISSFISILTAILCYYGIGKSFENSPYAKSLFWLSIFVGILILGTQVWFGYRNGVKLSEPNSENPYRDMVRCAFLIGISWTSFLNLFLGKHWAEEIATSSKEKEVSIKSLLPQKLLPQSLQIVYEATNKQYIIRLFAQNTESKERILLEKANEKLLLPFVYWLYFAIAKKKNILIRHEDIQVWKNRMVTYLNEKNEIPLDAFAVDGGKYELNIAAAAIKIEGLETLKEKQSVKDIFSNYLLETEGFDAHKFEKDKTYRLKIWEEVYEKQINIL